MLREEVQDESEVCRFKHLSLHSFLNFNLIDSRFCLK